MHQQLILDLLHVAEKAAIACDPWIGKGQEKAADQAAVSSMRQTLNGLSICGRVVIGEGERDEAPMLYIGEEVGTGEGPEIDIALDPLEGTTICAHRAPGSLAVIAAGPKGCFLHAPDVYMDKIAIGPGYPEGVISLELTPEENVKRVADAKGCAMDMLTVAVLKRPRHEALIAALRGAGVRVQLISDGDIAAVIATTMPSMGIDLYMGSGGAPEGVLAAAALAAVGGQMQGKLLWQDDAQIARAATMGITDPHRIYHRHELAHGNVILVAAGVTDGAMLKGVHLDAESGNWCTESLVFDAKHHMKRIITTYHSSRG